MINEEKHIKELTSLGLSENGAKTYITLLTKNSMTVGEIAKISGVPRPKLYEILTKLIEKGLCKEKIGRIKRYRVVDPDIVADNLIGDYQAQLQQKKIIAQNFSNAVNSIYQKNINKTDPVEYIEIIKNKEQVRKRWFDINRNAKKEILIFTKPPYASSPEEAIAEERKLQKNNNRKIIKQMDICEYKGITSESEKEEFIRIVTGLISNGEELRIVKELPMKLAIFDEKITMLSLNDPISLKPSITTMIVTHPSFAKAQKYVFESIWQKAMTLEEYMLKEKISVLEDQQELHFIE